jgi:signal transduction histidine kinase
MLTAALVAVGVAIALSLEPDAGDRAIAVAIVVAHVAPLAVRRRWPLAVLAAMIATALIAPVIGVPVVALGPASLVAVYTVGALFAPPRSTTILGVASAAMAIAVIASGMDAGTVVTNALAFAVAWWLGDRSRRALAQADAERVAASDVAARAVAAERLRIARELHDIVAHAMSVIAVQAGSGRMVIHESPEVARQALTTIEQTSRGALQEMRRLLAVLRDGTQDASTLEPSPGVADIGELVATTAQQGIAVQLRTDGEPVELPAGAGLCAYRIVQEALTNVRKHARATAAEVALRYGGDALEIEVVDDGVGANSAKDRGGHGLIGLRERAELYGGTFDAGPMASGFRVWARIPVGGRA